MREFLFYLGMLVKVLASISRISALQEPAGKVPSILLLWKRTFPR